MGLTMLQTENENDYFENKNFKVLDEILTPNNETTLKDFFTKKVNI